jgi:peptidoglycan/xylan/chitin deacetylase (PgdA/CDA1 family)
MSRCHVTFTPYRSPEECEAVEGPRADGPWAGELPWAQVAASPDTPDQATPWGNAAARDRLAAQAERRPDGNLAGPEHGVKAPDAGGFKGRIALTFDDGPSLETTPKVLEVLEKHGVQATFFVHGERVDSDEARALLARMAAAGHTIGNHAERHEDLGRNPARAAASAAATGDRIAEHVADRPRFFRFPGGNASPGAIAQVEGQGWAVTGWHLDAADWCYDDPRGGVGFCDPKTFRWVPAEHRDDMVANVLEQAGKFDGGILLLHDDRSYTADTLDALLGALRDAGYAFTGLDDAETFPELNAWAATLTPR